ncbi:hypothetical protein [Mycoplasmopsis columboralis]|uniref:DUF2779 domain-containing protein n=1 Tax=Mycoplasmopsis columboralis TaxID=171282 RepID=A0A449B732_9BACT|nr:hypothetical protein [Mycoplasmopsis columboralis]VEU76396.1 Uncharacterised protein [Mycoplasmopsis columboralis]
MNTKIYIDFEVIQTKDYKLSGFYGKLPFLYTIGFEKNQQFIYKTTLIRPSVLKNKKQHEIDNLVAANLTNSIKTLTGIKLNKKVNNIEFIGFNPNLERELLLKYFPNTVVNNIYEDNSSPVSLSNVLKELNIQQTDFFSYLKSVAKKDSKIIKALNKNKTGYVAEMCGVILLADSIKDKKIIKQLTGVEKINIDKIKSDLKLYNYEDVKAMEIINKNVEKVQILCQNQKKCREAKMLQNKISAKIVDFSHLSNEHLYVASNLLKIASEISDSALKNQLVSYVYSFFESKGDMMMSNCCKDKKDEVKSTCATGTCSSKQESSTEQNCAMECSCKCQKCTCTECKC